MSDKDTIYRQDAIDAMNQIYRHVEMIRKRPVTKGEQALFLDMRETIKALPSAQQCMTATSNTMVSDTVKIPIMDGTTERLPSAQPEIIKCKDCKYSDENWQRVSVRWLPCMDMRTGSNWYCGSAERREE